MASSLRGLCHTLPLGAGPQEAPEGKLHLCPLGGRSWGGGAGPWWALEGQAAMGGGWGAGRHFSPAGTKTVPVNLSWPGHRSALFSASAVAFFPLLTGHEEEE